MTHFHMKTKFIFSKKGFRAGRASELFILTAFVTFMPSQVTFTIVTFAAVVAYELFVTFVARISIALRNDDVSVGVRELRLMISLVPMIPWKGFHNIFVLFVNKTFVYNQNAFWKTLASSSSLLSKSTFYVVPVIKIVFPFPSPR